jgi:hypothetical protein
MMGAQSRETKVLVALLASIIAGALVLNAMGYNPPAAGAFCLSRYYRLAPVEKAVACDAAQDRGRWRRIEIFCSGGPVAQETAEAVPPAEPAEPFNSDPESTCHFVIHNGRTGYDGQIDATEYWTRQWSVNRWANSDLQSGPADALTIFVCLTTDSQTDRATDFQIKRAESLVEELCRRFNISLDSIHYPDTWR